MVVEWSKIISLLLIACLLCGSIAHEDSSRSSSRGSSSSSRGSKSGRHSRPVASDDRPTPRDCTSPGWRTVPKSASVMPGSYVLLNCRFALRHVGTVWVLNGMEDITTTSLARRVSLTNRNHSLQFGPLEAGDMEVVIGCRVVTKKYGVLPSPLATISVLTAPRYSARSFAVAVSGRPFELDMGYSASLPPSTFVWMKNGMLFRGDGVRVHVDHNSITFSRVEADDYGRYTVMARNQAGSGRAFTVLKVVTWPIANDDIISDLSPHLALFVALSQKRHNYTSSDSHTAIDRLGVMATIRSLLYQATPEAQRQGLARLELEELLERVQAMAGSRGNRLPPSDLATLNKATNCTAAQPSYDCTKYSVLKYRTYDGTCNNFFFPLYGAALTAFPRLLPAEYEDDISSPVGLRQTIAGDHTSPPWPSSRQISWKLGHSSFRSDSAPTGITHMVMQWGQFLDHDLDLSPVFDVECGCNHTKKCHPIHVSEKDETFGSSSSNNATCLSFSRSIPACRIELATNMPREQINQVTSYIDASQVYGSSRKLALSLRAKVGGLLKQGGRAESDKGNLPFQKDRPKSGLLPFFIAGDERANEQTGLTVMHTLWLREHNRIARSLAELNPCWEDERLYQESRKIVGAQMQKITFYDFLPMLFGSYLRKYIPVYKGYDYFTDASIPNSFAAGAYRFGHSLIRSQLLRLDENFTALDIGHLDLSRAFFNPVTYFESLGTDCITRGLMVDVSNPVDAFLNPVLTSQLFSKKPGTLGGDLASLNIQRGRDHGLPSYRTWQHFCQRKFPGHRAMFRKDRITRLRQLYRKEGFEDGMDLWVGGLSEEVLEGAQIGPTFACILGLSFSHLRDGDRFWFEEERQFSLEQRQMLKLTSLGRVVCDNGDNMRRVSQDVFRSDSVRVSCEEVPQLDLNSWKDHSCRRP